MTYEEALETKIRMCGICRNEAKPTKASCENCSDKVAIVAISKQIPKKPTNICIRCGFVVEGLCSTCGSAVLPEHKYCSNCSQKINWSDEGRKFENGFMVDDGGTTEPDWSNEE